MQDMIQSLKYHFKQRQNILPLHCAHQTRQGFQLKMILKIKIVFLMAQMFVTLQGKNLLAKSLYQVIVFL